ncbi:MAG: DUF1926 domain-containing protein [Treponema sp.]|nr:DUF1926 domain-containing protein [Treponema sp.]
MKTVNRINLILGSHAHVPSGAPESEFEFVYETKIRPFVSNLYRYSNIQAVLHYSGVLLYWVERTHPESFMLIEDMLSRKQAEIIGGGFYEPIFPLISLQDRIGQIELMTTYLRKHFGKRPTGCWVPGMAWEQNLAVALCTSDMNYTFLSQDQFEKAGLEGSDLFKPCLSEDQGKLVAIFPVSRFVEKELSRKSFSQVFVDMENKFKEICPNCKSDKIISVFPESVSSSPEEAPDTAWNRFFEEISLSDNIVSSTLPFKILKTYKIFKKASFPNSTSLENDFSPRRFLIDNADVSGIYSKMIFTNLLINQLKGDKARKLNAREEMWKAQDSCFFSAGNEQYRNELRKSAYSSLLRAEKLSREKGLFVPSLIQYDFNFDGKKEFIFQDEKINCYIQHTGAGIFELDYLPKEWNYLDCGTSSEPDKTRLAGTDNLNKRIAFADMLFPANEKFDNLINILPDNGRFCYHEQYEEVTQDKKGKSCFKLPVRADNVPFGYIEINKCYLLKKDNLSVSYQLVNKDKETASFLFVPEIDFSFAGVGDEFVRFYTVDSGGKDISIDRLLDSNNLKILDVKNEVQILLSSVNNFTGCLFPVFKYDMYQATRILPVFSVTLDSGVSWSNEFTLKFSH